MWINMTHMNGKLSAHMIWNCLHAVHFLEMSYHEANVLHWKYSMNPTGAHDMLAIRQTKSEITKSIQDLSTGI